MQKAIAVFAIAVFAAAAVHAQQTEKPDPARVAYDEAHAYVLADLKSNGWANAADHLARYDQVLVDFPDAPRDIMRAVQKGRFFSIYRSGDYAGAIDAGEAFLRDYGDASETKLANVLLYVGISHEKLGDANAAQSAYERGLADYPNAAYFVRCATQCWLADLLARRGEKAAAQAAYMSAVTNYAWYYSIPNEQNIIWRAFDKVNPTLHSTADYRAFLEATLKATRATEENARFLGRVKSELEKIK